MKELYLTWDLTGRVEGKPTISLWGKDREKQEPIEIFTTKEPIGIKNITYLINQKEPTQHCASVKKTPTNFDKITESVESLASVLKSFSNCELNLCNECPLYKSKCADVKSIIEWLEKESE